MTSLGQLASSQVRRSRSDPGFEELHPRRRRPELSRVTVLVGRLLIDVGVPSRIITSAVANDVIELANDQLPARTGLETAFDNAEGRWTLARLTGAVIDPDRSLAEVGRWIDEVSSCSRSSQRACAPAVSARDARVRRHRSARM